MYYATSAHLDLLTESFNTAQQLSQCSTIKLAVVINMDTELIDKSNPYPGALELVMPESRLKFESRSAA